MNTKLPWIIWSRKLQREVGCSTQATPPTPESLGPDRFVAGIRIETGVNPIVIHGGLSSPYVEELTIPEGTTI